MGCACRDARVGTCRAARQGGFEPPQARLGALPPNGALWPRPPEFFGKMKGRWVAHFWYWIIGPRGPECGLDLGMAPVQALAFAAAQAR